MRVAVAQGEALAVGVQTPVATPEAEREQVADEVKVAVMRRVGLQVREAGRDTDTVGDGEGVHVGLPDRERVSVRGQLHDAEGVSVGVSQAETVSDGVRDAVGPVATHDRVRDAEGPVVAVRVRERRQVAVSVSVVDGLHVCVRDGDGVELAAAEGGLTVGVRV